MSDTMELEVPEVEELEVEPVQISPEAAAARLRLRGFLVRPHGIKWLVLQDGNPRRLTLSPDDLSLAAKLAQATDDRLTTDQLAEQLYAATGTPLPGTSEINPPGGWGYQSLLIRQIRRDGGTQARVGLNEDTVQDYAELMREKRWDFKVMQRPIVLFDGDSFWLADGFHRIEAAQRAGLSDYPIEVLRGTKRDAILRAAGANATHGLRRSNEDKRRAVELLLKDEEWRQWSDRKIANVCAVSDPFVGSVRKELSANGSQMPETRKVERNGSTYQMTPAAPKPKIPEVAPADITDEERRIAALAGYIWEDSDLLPGKQATYHFKSTGGVIDGAIMTRPQFDAWLKIHAPIERAPTRLTCPTCGEPILNGIWGDRQECGSCYHARQAAPVPTAPAETDDSQVKTQIREKASGFNLELIWEDAGVILYWPGEDIEQMDTLSYAVALEWLEGDVYGAWERYKARLIPEIAPDPDVSDRSAHLAKEARDAGRIERARTAIELGNYSAARAELDQVEVSTLARDRLLATIPIGRRVVLDFTDDDCLALLKEARWFLQSEPTKKLPAIRQTLGLLIEAIKGAT